MSSLQPGPKKLGKYEILEVIGRGGMGVVYKAVDPEIGRLVGIKMMTSAVINDPDLLKRFYREAQSSGKLQHPNIVTIYDLGVHEATPYLVMEFLEGESLDSVIGSRRAISMEEKLNIAIQVCNALAYAHEHGVVHRDIKPGNVMLLKDGTVKIVDFGIARMGGDKVTRTGQVMGSVQFMSPEQINGAHVDQRTDIFSAGVLLYQLLTYVLPFEGKETGDTLLKIIHGEPPPLSQFLQKYPPELETILLRALAKDPEERYQTGTELALDLSHVQDELKRESISEYLRIAQGCIAESQWTKAKEQLLQVLKIDRQNVRGTMLLREVQQEMQKQQRSERARDLRAQAEQAIAKGEFDEAVRYLGMAVDLVPGSAELLHLQNWVKQKKATVDRLAQLLRNAESARDGGDLEGAQAATGEALQLDPENTEAKALHAVITRELAEHATLKQVQTFVDEARKQISSRRFTAALEVLKKAELLDPTATGINELISLAYTGQQQEQRRKELEQIAADVEEALNHRDHVAACARVEKGLQKFPDDRGLLKLKVRADKEREAHEKRTYIENQVSLARRLLEEHRAQEALPPLEEALARYPEEFVLKTMHALVTENIEREQIEQFKAQTLQQAKEAIRRKDFHEAVDILQAAQRQAPSSEFEDLLQFVADEAAAHEKRLVIDAAAEEAHRLISAEEYERAISRLEETLKTSDDQELRIILADAQRLLERFNNGVQEAITTAHRLMQCQRYSEAVRFMEGQLPTYGKSPEFRAALEELRLEEERLQAFSAVKERVREALANSNYGFAQANLESFRHQFGDSRDTQLLRNEIEAKREQVATIVVEQALKDVRILFLVHSYATALGVLDRVAGDIVRVAPELREKYETLRKNAETVLERERQYRDQRDREKREFAERISDQPTLDQSNLEDAALADDELTQKADPAKLEELLGEVTLVGQRYAQDQTIQNEITELREKLTCQLAELRHTRSMDQATLMAPVPPQVIQASAVVFEVAEATQQVHQTKSDSPQQTEAELVQGLVPGSGEAAGSIAPAEPPSKEALEGLPTIVVAPLAATETTPKRDFAETAVGIPVPEFTESKESTATPAEVEQEKENSIHLVAETVVVRPEQPRPLTRVGPAPEAPVKAAETLVFPGSQQETVLTSSVVPASIEVPEQPVLIRSAPMSTPAVHTQTIASQRLPLRQPQSPAPDTGLDLAFLVSGKRLILVVLAIVAIAVIWGVLHLLLLNPPKVTSSPAKTAAATPPAINPIELQQKQAMADSDKRVAAGDLEGARQILQKATGLNGPLTGEINKQLVGIDKAINDQGLRELRKREEQLWQQAQTDVAAGRFNAAQKSLQQILALPEGATRKDEVQRYLKSTLPKRRKEEFLFAQAQHASEASDAISLQRAEDLLAEVIAQDGPRKSEATRLRSSIHDRLAALKQQREQQIATLLGEARQAARQGDIRGALQKASEIKQLGGDTTSLLGEIDQAERAQQAKASAKAAFERVLQRYRSGSSANDKTELESVRNDLVAIAQGGGPHAAEAQSYVSEVDRKLAALNQPPVARRSAKPSAADLDSIRAVVQRYAKAFEQRDVDMLRQVWPSMDSSMYSSYKTNFGDASAIGMKVQIRSVSFGADEASAIVSALVTQRYTPKGFGPRKSTDAALFQLVKRGDVWLISEVR